MDNPERLTSSNVILTNAQPQQKDKQAKEGGRDDHRIGVVWRLSKHRRNRC